jgi:pimeloyl-ACP methyl ester carboxylesterase
MHLVDSKGCKIATECFGSRHDPALILIMGATASMLGWPDTLCTALADKGLFVVRFDHRDTGMSTTLPPGKAEYAVEDMAEDVVSIMEAYGLFRVALMGMSLGGYIAQILSLQHPTRIHALVLLGAEPIGWDGPPLPHISERFLSHFGKVSSLDWNDNTAVTDFLLEIERLSVGTGQAFCECEKKARIQQVLRRTSSPASMFNHASVPVRNNWTGRYREVACPTLVIHGTEDPVLPIENGRAVSTGIHNAEFMALEKVGHEIPESSIAALADRVAQHVRSS